LLFTPFLFVDYMTLMRYVLPKFVQGLEKKIVIKAERQFSLALMESKKAYSWVCNQFGQDSI